MNKFKSMLEQKMKSESKTQIVQDYHSVKTQFEELKQNISD